MVSRSRVAVARACLAVCAGMLLPGAGWVSQAAAAPSPPAAVATEDFEHGTGSTPVLLSDYEGAGGAGYAADAPWLRACNGVVVAWSAPESAMGTAGCTLAPQTSSTAYASLRMMAHALGQLSGTDPTTNHALAAYTDGEDPGPGLVELRATAPLALDGGSRFLAVRVDTAAVNCDVSPARLQLAFRRSDGTELAAGAPLDACSGGSTVVAPTPPGSTEPLREVLVAHRSTDGAALVTGSSAALVVRNENGSGSGNDAALDNLRVVDVTPRLTTTFAPTVVAPGQVSRLTLTVSNTSELDAKDGFSFTEVLPTGLRVAADPRVWTSCVGPSVTGATTGSGTVHVVGSLAVGRASCTISFDVAGRSSGTYTNAPGTNVRDLVGLRPPTSVRLVVREPSLRLTKTATLALDRNGDRLPGVGDLLAYRLVVRNAGPGTVTGVQVRDRLTSPAGPAVTVTCPRSVLLPGAQMTCSTSPYAVTQVDVDRGGVTNMATARATVPGTGGTVESAPARVRTETVWGKGISIVKRVALADGDGDGMVDPGERVRYRFEVRNTGVVTLTGIRVDDPALDQLGLDAACPRTTLAPGAVMACLSPWYVVRSSDLGSGRLDGVVVSAGGASGLVDAWSGTRSGADQGEGGPADELAFTGARIRTSAVWGAVLLLCGALAIAVSAACPPSSSRRR